MYSWGDDTYTWKNPGAYNFGSARRAYLDSLKNSSTAKGARSYAVKSGPDMKLVDPKAKNISSDSKNPIIIAVDVTGSMSTWPAEIFDRLPLLYQTLSKYKDDVELSFVAIGDGYTDSFPLQVSDFGKGTTLDDYLKALYPEGGGGGQHFESYELFAYFVDNHVKTPKATSPFLILMGDEGFYEKINKSMVEHFVGDKLQDDLDAKTVWSSVGKKFNTYLLHKEYNGLDKEIVGQWSEAIGQQKVIPVSDPTRIVDVAMGIVARSWGNFDDFGKSLKARQDSKGIKTVMDSLKYVSVPDPANTNSVVPSKKSGKVSKKLT
ncbi:hypothetical protein HY837_02065 [archaeon]|nr:hypothetical protein [archaeon]